MSNRKRPAAQAPEPADPLADLTSPAAIDALVETGADLLRPSNRTPREVVQDLVAGEQDWQALEAQVVTVHHTRDYGRNKIELELASDRDTPAYLEATSILQKRCKARLIRHADPHDASQFADRSQYPTPCSLCQARHGRGASAIKTACVASVSRPVMRQCA